MTEPDEVRLTVDLVALFLNFVPPGQNADPTSEVVDLDVRRPVRQVDQLGQQRILELVAAYIDGLSVSQLAVQFGVNVTTIRTHLQRSGVQMRPFRKLSPSQIQEARQLHIAGASLVELATRFGASVSTIRRLLAESGLT